MLHLAVEENAGIVKKHEQKIKKNIDQWFKKHIKLKTWNYLDQKNNIILKKRRILQENTINDEFSQFKFFKKGNYDNIKSSE